MLSLTTPSPTPIRRCAFVSEGRFWAWISPGQVLVPQKTWVRKSNIRVDCYVLTERKLNGQIVHLGHFVHPQSEILMIMRQFVSDVKHQSFWGDGHFVLSGVVRKGQKVP